MRRTLWLMEKRRAAVLRYDRLFAPIYDEKWGAVIDRTHRSYILKLIENLGPCARVLDAACGTGKYLPLFHERHIEVVCVDQSAEMLRVLVRKFPRQAVFQQSLQELRLNESFDAVTCVDAMENIPPEDWPLVLSNFAAHLRPGGLLYITVEREDSGVLKEEYERARKKGLPVVFGEVAVEGYHYYPSDFRVRKWLKEASFTVKQHSVGDGYWHLLCSKEGDEEE